MGNPDSAVQIRQDLKNGLPLCPGEDNYFYYAIGITVMIRELHKNFQLNVAKSFQILFALKVI
jgi:hypothetical protein